MKGKACAILILVMLVVAPVTVCSTEVTGTPLTMDDLKDLLDTGLV
jgi:hypothetical protein